MQFFPLCLHRGEDENEIVLFLSPPLSFFPPITSLAWKKWHRFLLFQSGRREQKNKIVEKKKEKREEIIAEQAGEEEARGVSSKLQNGFLFFPDFLSSPLVFS